MYTLGRDGELDLPLVERFIRCVGIYPVGSCVGLNTGEVGIVTQIHRDQLLTPKLIVVRDADGRPVVPAREIDLLDQSAKPLRTIMAVLRPGEIGINPNRYLDESASPSPLFIGASR